MYKHIDKQEIEILEDSFYSILNYKIMSDKLKSTLLTKKRFFIYLTELSKQKNILRALDLLNKKMLFKLNVTSEEPIQLMELMHIDVMPISKFFVDYSNSSNKNIADYIMQWEDDLNVTNFMEMDADDISLYDSAEFIKQRKDSYSYDIDSQFVEDYGDTPQALYLNYLLPDSIKKILLSLAYTICPSDTFNLKVFTDQSNNRTIIVYHAEFATMSFYSILAILCLIKEEDHV